MGSIFSPPKPPKVDPLPPAPVVTDPAVTEAAKRERMAATRRGRQSTILTDQTAQDAVPGGKTTLGGAL
jgi:hypothetical protein